MLRRFRSGNRALIALCLDAPEGGPGRVRSHMNLRPPAPADVAEIMRGTRPAHAGEQGAPRLMAEVEQGGPVRIVRRRS